MHVEVHQTTIQVHDDDFFRELEHDDVGVANEHRKIATDKFPANFQHPDPTVLHGSTEF